MKAQRYHSVGLAVLCSALVLLSGNVHAQSSSSTPSSGCSDALSSDGDCDLDNNTEECGYDGGDCCECTCVDSAAYTCGVRAGFSCLDPSASCYVDDGDDDIPEATLAPTTPTTPAPVIATTTSPTPAPETATTPSPTMAPVTATTPPPVTAPTTSPTPSTPTTTSTSSNTPSPVTSSSSTTPTSTSTTPCDPDAQSDGNCDLENNSENCGYDGGDCCECTCVTTTDFTCGDSGYDCVDPDTFCEADYVEAGRKTTITAFANGFDERPGPDNGGSGCFVDGCEAALTRDGLLPTDTESRWSCAQKLVPGGAACFIEFLFEDPQDVKDVVVAFWKGEERTRTVEAAINGEVIGDFDSYMGSPFNSLGISGDAVTTFSLAAVGLGENDWISFTEVRFLVEA